MTASTSSPSASASASRFSTTTPAPSARTKPSARASNALQRPSGAIMCARDRMIVVSGERITFTPPARAIRHSPLRRLWHGEVDRHQRRRARGVDRHVRALQVEQVGEAAGRDAVRAAGGDVGVESRRVAAHDAVEVVGVAQADEHAGGAAGQPIGGLAGVLQRLPGHLEQQPLLRIHARRLARGDPEELRIESVHVGEEAAVAGRHLPRRVRIGIEVGVDVPAIARHLGDRVAAPLEELPESGGRLGARQATADPDHRERLRRRGLERLDLGLQLDREQGEALGRQLGDAVEEFAHAPPPSGRSPPSRASSMRSTSSSLSCSSRLSMPLLVAVGSGASAVSGSTPREPSTGPAR